MPATGYARDGMCAAPGDEGKHHVCIKDIDKSFCDATHQADWCSGNKNWCVCQWAYADAIKQNGCDKYEIDCEATNIKALEAYENDPDYAHAYKCLKEKCKHS